MESRPFIGARPGCCCAAGRSPDASRAGGRMRRAALAGSGWTRGVPDGLTRRFLALLPLLARVLRSHEIVERSGVKSTSRRNIFRRRAEPFGSPGKGAASDRESPASGNPSRERTRKRETDRTELTRVASPPENAGFRAFASFRAFAVPCPFVPLGCFLVRSARRFCAPTFSRKIAIPAPRLGLGRRLRARAAAAGAPPDPSQPHGTVVARARG